MMRRLWLLLRYGTLGYRESACPACGNYTLRYASGECDACNLSWIKR